MTEIFPSLIESTCIDSRVLANLPPVGKSIYDKNGNNIGLDTTNIKREREIYEREELRIKNDTSKIIFAFDSKIKRNRNNVEEDFEKHFSGAKIFESKKEQNLEYDFDFKELKIKNKFVLENISEFPKGKGEIWKIL
ncbi:MAG TPA: hypothetical protein PLQ70_06045 [Flavobacterium alvei]|nr:hypothetical protein [Flavobacterium alvei]